MMLMLYQLNADIMLTSYGGSMLCMLMPLDKRITIRRFHRQDYVHEQPLFSWHLWSILTCPHVLETAVEIKILRSDD